MSTRKRKMGTGTKVVIAILVANVLGAVGVTPVTVVSTVWHKLVTPSAHAIVSQVF